MSTLTSLCILFLACLPLIFTISDFIKDKKLDRFAARWFEDEENIKLYNRFIKYLTTNLETGLEMPMRFPLPKIYSASDFFELEGVSRIAARAAVDAIMLCAKARGGIEGLKNNIDEYLEQAEINKQLRGF